VHPTETTGRLGKPRDEENGGDPVTRSPQHARGAIQREAAVDRERAGRRDKADTAILAVRLTIIAWELIQAALDHTCGGDLRRFL
jgi:hypothetical protein